MSFDERVLLDRDPVAWLALAQMQGFVPVIVPAQTTSGEPCPVAAKCRWPDPMLTLAALMDVRPEVRACGALMAAVETHAAARRDGLVVTE